MVNALGVLGWGVGGIDAESALLGEAYVFPIPEVVGVQLDGTPPPGVYTTDVVLMITQRLRREKVTSCAVEFFGDAVGRMAVPERATIANMAPEYGATCGFFAVDEATLSYLRSTGRSDAQVALVETFAKRVGLFRNADHQAHYARTIRIDLSETFPSIAGPSRPQERMRLSEVAPDFRRRLGLSIAEGGFARSVDAAGGVPGQPEHGAVAIAAITSCTNTSNPQVMIAAGLVARNCVRLGLKPPRWVKTSLAPGAPSVTRYLEAAGLMAPLRELGFEIVGYGCTTCGGKSGPLVPEMAELVEKRGLVAAAVLSGNRNFPGRIHKLVQANYLMAPPLVVAYAIAGRIDFDPMTEPLASDAQGRLVYLKDVLPEDLEIEALLAQANNPAHYAPVHQVHPQSDSFWESAEASLSPVFPWAPSSTYLVKPPFFAASTDTGSGGVELLSRQLRNTRVLVLLGTSVTTDHISPSGEIPIDSPSGRYLIDQGVAQKDFNTYVGRRGNHHVMVRGTFANIRLRNQLTPELEGGWTLQFPERRVVTIFDAAMHYRQREVGLIVIAGTEYGTGSSRDWAAKGTALLGVKAVIAESFERIHRANLIGMGVLPMRFRDGEGWRQLGLNGSESYTFEDVEAGVRTGASIRACAERSDGTRLSFEVFPEMRTAAERRLMAAGGLPSRVLRDLLKGVPSCA
jgi:aconitate hydratase